MQGRLGSTPFSGLLCNSLAADQTTAAIAEALDAPLLEANKAIPSVLIYARLAVSKPEPLAPAIRRLAELAGGLKPVPEELLDLLAWQFHVDGYETALTYGAKRALVDKSILLHRRKGTPWAVVNALQAAFATDADLAEWFEYGGNPYFFRVGLDVTQTGFDQAAFRRAFTLIHEYKNVRSWLDLFVTRSKEPVAHDPGAAALGHAAVKIRPYFASAAPEGAKRYRACALYGIAATRPSLWFMAQTPAPGKKGSAATIAGNDRAKFQFYAAPRLIRKAGNFSGAGISAITKSLLAFDWQNPRAQPGRSAAQYGFITTSLKFYGGANG